MALFARPPLPFSSLDFLFPALEGPGDEGPHPPGERGGPPRVYPGDPGPERRYGSSSVCKQRIELEIKG